MSVPKVLVIIPTRGHFDYVRRAVVSLERAEGATVCSSHYIVIDDASPEWPTIDWDSFPTRDCRRIHFHERAGLTRSWNYGLQIARNEKFDYAVCANSDLVFSMGWLTDLILALEEGCSLVGPMTNAPGHCTWQNIRPFLPSSGFRIDDTSESIEEVSEVLRKAVIGPIECPINGFCLAAKTETWWRGAFTNESVFNPSYPLERNEVELQKRWRRIGMKSAMVPRSYVFHYRSISRPEGLREKIARGAFRPIYQHQTDSSGGEPNEG